MHRDGCSCLHFVGVDLLWIAWLFLGWWLSSPLAGRWLSTAKIKATIIGTIRLSTKNRESNTKRKEHQGCTEHKNHASETNVDQGLGEGDPKLIRVFVYLDLSCGSDESAMTVVVTAIVS